MTRKEFVCRAVLVLLSKQEGSITSYLKYFGYRVRPFASRVARLYSEIEEVCAEANKEEANKEKGAEKTR